MKLGKSLQIIILLASLSLLITACGSDSTSDNTLEATTEVSGSVFAAPVNGATVVIKDANGTVVAGPVTTSADGVYTVQIPTSSLSTDIRVESVGGTYSDEATGTTTTAGTLAAYVSAGTLSVGATVHLDPSSTIIHGLVTGGSKTVGGAQTIFNTVFGYTPDMSIQPKNAPASAETTTAQRLAGLRAGAFSQLTKDMGQTPDMQFDIMKAIVQDLSDDDALNGSSGTVNGAALSEDIQFKFENALVSYLTDTTKNRTGLSCDQIGDLPFAKIVLTPSYHIEFIPGMMTAKVGKTTFKIKITNRTDGTPATGKSVTLMPLMHMKDRNHTTPVDAVAEDTANPGTYNCTAYYLMASGPNMGYWDMKVMIGGGMGMGESAVFHPRVGMAMGDTARVDLNGVNDVISGMMGTTKRKYILFNDGLISGTTSTFNLFIATMENMMNFPGVSGNTILTSPTGTWSVDPATTQLQAATDVSFASPVTGIDNGNGHWSLPGISGLATGVTGTLYVKFTVNSEIKTSGTGTAALDYATFSLTPR